MDLTVGRYVFDRSPFSDKPPLVTQDKMTGEQRVGAVTRGATLGTLCTICPVLRRQSKTEHKAERLVKKVDARFKAQASASLAPGEWGAMTWIDRYVWMD